MTRATVPSALVPLDPLTVPLWGTRLIEASAGTGKTWTIAALYLRLVLGHGDAETGFGRSLAPREILVMTFTVAATRELSERVRERLVQAARCFRGDAAPDPADTFLASLLDEYRDARASAAYRLASAAEEMDDASVLTIDAWVQRMLREHAFDSGSAFDEELQPDVRPFLTMAAQDYWRQEVYPLRGSAVDDVLAVWPTVGALNADLEKLFAYDDDGEGDARSLATVLADIDDAVASALPAIKAGWVERARAMRAWLEPQLGTGVFSKTKLKPEAVPQWFDALDAWASSPQLAFPAIDRGRRFRLTRAGLIDAFNKNKSLDIPAVFDEVAPLIAKLDALPERRAAIRRHAMRRVAARLSALKRRAGMYGFQDMLVRLERALSGPHGEVLRTRMLAQYPVALIDEFQDTSPVQYRIFDRLYGVAANDRSTALFLIGDPKQSIYGFRGADIRSYLRAAASVEDRRYPLTTNYRSTIGCVDAVNRLFENAEERPGEGAFRFRAPLGDDPLPFVTTQALGRPETLVDANGSLPALRFVHDAQLKSRADAYDFIAGHCAQHIVGLLDDPRAGFAQGDAFTRLKARDIAVLVRTGAEADTIRRALRIRGVHSVYLSDSESIFRADEAHDLLHWLRAVAEPGNARLARAAFATRLIGFSFEHLVALNADDVAFEAQLEIMRSLNDVWRRQGILSMLRATLHRYRLPARWLADEDEGRGGERRLTNVLHLAELLQSASAALEGEQALIRWLSLRVSNVDWPADEQIVRLESDADLVQVVTVHKAKGLEYPIVCLPFGTGFRGADKRDFDVVERDGLRVVSFDLPEDLKSRLEEEQRQEAMRLFYVAVTRARHALWIGVPSLASQKGDKCVFDRSPLGYLVAGRPVDAGEIAGLLAKTFAGLPQVRVETVTDVAARTRVVARDERAALRAPPTYDGAFDRDWSIGSFSAFVRDLERGAPVSAAPPALIDPAVEEELRTAPLEVDEPIASTAARHRFPRGAFVGNLLHDQLEWLAERRFALTADESLRAALAERCARLGWGRRAADVVTWLGEVVSTPLPPLGVALDALPLTSPEMEFWFPSESVDAVALDALCRVHLLGGRERPALPVQTVRGMLMGFMDLVFEHDGRYWVLDYKSNALGTRDADYTTEALEASMAAHRYDVQGAIYLLALHRLLRSRLGDRYDPARQLGGTIDLFLRGIKGPAAGCVVLAPSIAVVDALDRLMDGARA